jgi:hypothetical protein
MESRGELRGLEQQPRFEFTEEGRTVFIYTADFAWFIGDCRVIEDTKTKGTATPVYRLKKRLIEARFGVVITEWPIRKRKKRKAK